MNNKLSSELIDELGLLTLKEMQNILKHFNDPYDNDYYNTWKYIAKTYTDEQVKSLLPIPIKLKSKDNRSTEEKLQELKKYYVKGNVENQVTTSDIPMFKRGRKKKETTLKDRVFEVLNANIGSNGTELDYKGILENGILDIAENTYKTILSQWRKTKGIKIKRGRPSKNS